MAKKTYQRVVDLLNEHIPEKVSRNEFCRATGVNRNSVDRYRAGLGCPNDETLKKLADYFGVSVPWLRGDVNTTLEQEKAYLAGWANIQKDLRGEKDNVGYAEQIKDIIDVFTRQQCLAAEQGDLDEVSRLEEIKSCLDKYLNLFVAFISVPVEDIEMVMALLDITKEMKIENPDEWEISDKWK